MSDTLIKVLQFNHPDAMAPTSESHNIYREPSPDQVLLYINMYLVAAVTKRILGEARPGGADLVSLQHWIMNFGRQAYYYGRLLCLLRSV